VPSRMAPTCRGNANIAATPVARAASRNIGQRPSCSVTSATSTGLPVLKASTPGPSRTVYCDSSKPAAHDPLAASNSSARALVRSVTAAPSARTEAQTPHTAASQLSPWRPTRSAISAHNRTRRPSSNGHPHLPDSRRPPGRHPAATARTSCFTPDGPCHFAAHSSPQNTNPHRAPQD
jgi:hypothetical protein